MWVVLLFSVFGMLVLYIGLPAVLKPFLRRRFLGQVRKSGFVCLTFDDGPDPLATPAVLRMLEQFGVKATFFVLGKKALEYPHLVRAIRDAGHQIGEHGFGHPMAWFTGPVRAVFDMVHGARAIRNAGVYRQPFYYRPPYGKLNLASLLCVWMSGRHLAFWDADPRDYEQSSGEKVAASVLDNLQPGAVILLHDGRLARGKRFNATLNALPLILCFCKDAGLLPVTLEEACASSFTLRKQNPRIPHRISQP